MSKPDEKPRSVAEWTTLVASCLVLAVVVGLIVARLGDPKRPPEPVATITGQIRSVGDEHHVTVEVTNTGNATAAQVQVEAQLEVGGQVNSGDQVVDFLAANEVVNLVFVFEGNPAEGQLSVRVTGYTIP